MISNRWIEQRKTCWSRLDALLRQVESGGLKSLAGAELREFGLLYRQTAADLSAARADRASRTLEEYLNQLLSRAHNFVYSGNKFSFGSVMHFFAVDYPRLVRRMMPYIVAATLMFLAGAALGTLITLARPEFMHRMLGPVMVATIERHEMWTHSIVSAKPQTSSSILTNNISVCFLTFASGILAGVGTIYMMFFNGLLIGVISTACAQAHLSRDLWSFVAAHGSLELPSIMLAGGAGLRLAWGLLFPGMMRRKDSLAVAGGEAVRLISGIIPLLFVAGILEGFLSPSGAPVALKFIVGGFLFTCLCAWLSMGGRESGTNGKELEKAASLDLEVLIQS